MLDRLSVNNGSFELLENAAVDGVTLRVSQSVFQFYNLNANTLRKRDLQSLLSCTWRTVTQPGKSNPAAFPSVWCKPGLGSVSPTWKGQGLLVKSLSRAIQKIGIHGLHEFVDVPSVFRADGYRVGNSIQQVELLDTDGIDFVQDVDDRNVAPRLGLYYVDEIVHRGIASNRDVG